MRNHVHPRTRQTEDVAKSRSARCVITTMPCSEPPVPDQKPWHRGRPRHQCVKGGDDRLATGPHEVQDVQAPLAGIQAELVLQAHHVKRAVIGHIRGQAVCIMAAVVDNMDYRGSP